MPIEYPDGVLSSHKHCRAKAGLFDAVSLGCVASDGEVEVERRHLEFPKVDSPKSASLVINPAVDRNAALIYEVIGDRDQAMNPVEPGL